MYFRFYFLNDYNYNLVVSISANSKTSSDSVILTSGSSVIPGEGAGEGDGEGVITWDRGDMSGVPRVSVSSITMIGLEIFLLCC